MKTEREFDLGDVLSITTGRLVSPRHINGVYDILNFMTGDNLYTHALPRASDECRPRLLEQHPELVSVDATGVTPETWRGWLDEQEARFGKHLMVRRLDPEDHTQIHPLQEESIRGKRIIIVSDEPN